MELINDEDLEQVAGGLLSFNNYTKTLTFTDNNTGAVKEYKIADYRNTCKLSQDLLKQNMDETEIIETLIKKRYIEK